jgi:hypothetical protein
MVAEAKHSTPQKNCFFFFVVAIILLHLQRFYGVPREIEKK